jgi:hypothetical protein
MNRYAKKFHNNIYFHRLRNFFIYKEGYGLESAV